MSASGRRPELRNRFPSPRRRKKPHAPLRSPNTEGNGGDGEKLAPKEGFLCRARDFHAILKFALLFTRTQFFPSSRIRALLVPGLPVASYCFCEDRFRLRSFFGPKLMENKTFNVTVSSSSRQWIFLLMATTTTTRAAVCVCSMVFPLPCTMER